jgi:hypothetical protein
MTRSAATRLCLSLPFSGAGTRFDLRMYACTPNEMGRKYLSIAVSKKTREEAEKALCGDADRCVVSLYPRLLGSSPRGTTFCFCPREELDRRSNLTIFGLRRIRSKVQSYQIWLPSTVRLLEGDKVCLLACSIRSAVNCSRAPRARSNIASEFNLTSAYCTAQIRVCLRVNGLIMHVLFGW